MLAAILLCCSASAHGAETGSTHSGTDPQQAASEAVVVARGLIATGRPEAAYRLLYEATQAASAHGIDTTDIRYWAAQALLAGRHYPQATELLGGLAEERPDLDRARLDYAAVLFTLGRDDEAGTVFRDIRRDEDLPTPVRRRVEQYLERIRARQRLRVDWDFGVWRDDNVNNAPEIEGVEIPLFGGLRFSLDQRPVPAWIARTGARFRWRTPVWESSPAFFETHASVARNTALGASEYNRTTATASTGPRVPYAIRLAGRRRPGLFRADVGVERRWQGGDGYTAGVWTGLGVDQSVGHNWRVGLFPRVWTTRYDEGAEGAQPRGRSLGLYVARRVGPGWLTAQSKVSRETPEWRTRRWVSREASVHYAIDIGRDWSVAVQAGLTRTKFDEEELLFLTLRDDRTHILGVTASHRGLAWEGYLPELTLSWSQTSSSIPLYDRKRPMVRLGLRRLF